MKHIFISFILVAPMKNLYQQTRFDFPMPTIKFLCINCSSINKYICTLYTVFKMRNHQVFGPLVSV